MMKDRSRRFPSMAILLQELERCLTTARGTGPAPGAAAR
jgi:hypothetical protein